MDQNSQQFYEQSDPSQPNIPRRGKHPLANYQFSSEELKVLQQCNTESFFQRSLPLGTSAGLAVYFGVKNGYLKPSGRWGAGPKVALGVIFGYFVGKFSYQQKCADKLMQLPNSRLAEMLKAKKKGSLYESFSPDQGFGASLAMGPFSSVTDSYSDELNKPKSQISSLDIDTDRPSQSGLDEAKRGNVDAERNKFEVDIPLGPALEAPATYDELRQRNREEYQKRSSSNQVYIPRDEQPVVIRAPQRSDETPQTKGQKNKYGDVWTQ